jgi:hypothetical protein
VASLFGSYSGKLIIKVGDCLNYLRSGASGYVRYDASTESVVIDNALPAVSNTPNGTSFGYLAKTVPVRTPVYNESLGTCTEVVTQGLASQVMDARADGQLVVANSPLPGEIAACDSADAQNQVRLDYLDPEIAEDETTVSPDVRFLAGVPFNKQSGSNTIVAQKWVGLRELTLRKSQWSQVTKDGYSNALQAAFVPVEGGAADDPAFRLVLSESMPSNPVASFPANPSQGDTIIWNGPAGTNNPNLPANAWVNYPRGLGFMPFSSPRDIVVGRTTAGSVTVTLPDHPEVASGIKGIMFYSKTNIGSTGSSAKASFGSRVIAYAVSGPANPYMETTVYFNPSPDSNQIVIDFIKTGAASTFTVDISVIGYYL